MEEARDWRFGGRTYNARQELQHWRTMLPADPPSPGLDPDGSEEESSSGEGEEVFQGPVNINDIGSALLERQRQQGKRGRVTAPSEAAILRLLREVACCSDDCCAICLEDFAAADPDVPLRAMPSCSHAFHKHCILKWLSRNAVCPVCRRQLPLSEEGDDEEQEYARRRRRPTYDDWLARVAYHTQQRQRGRVN